MVLGYIFPKEPNMLRNRRLPSFYEALAKYAKVVSAVSAHRRVSHSAAMCRTLAYGTVKHGLHYIFISSVFHTSIQIMRTVASKRVAVPFCVWPQGYGKRPNASHLQYNMPCAWYWGLRSVAHTASASSTGPRRRGVL